MICIIQCNRHICIADRPAVLCPCKNNVLHACAAQLFGALLSQNPSDRVCHIALSASIRSYDSGNPVVEVKHDLICERLKTMHFYAL